MTVFVLTHCADNDNYTPQVFLDEETAKQVLKDEYEEVVDDAGNSVSIAKYYGTRATIDYKDDTCDVWEIFPCKIKVTDTLTLTNDKTTDILTFENIEN